MELRVLQYFLAVTREQSISGAAEALHLSQPTLSRQLKEMEEELEFPRFIPLNKAKSVFDQDDNRKFGGINTAPSLFDQQAAIHTGR